MKKDPVLWVVVGASGLVWSTSRNARAVQNQAKILNREHPDYAPFRVVKYLPAPKTKKRNRK